MAGQSLLTKGRGISLEGVSLTEGLGRAVLPSPFEGMLEGNSNKSTGSEIFLTYDLPFTKISVCMKKGWTALTRQPVASLLDTLVLWASFCVTHMQPKALPLASLQKLFCGSRGKEAFVEVSKF